MTNTFVTSFIQRSDQSLHQSMNAMSTKAVQYDHQRCPNQSLDHSSKQSVDLSSEPTSLYNLFEASALSHPYSIAALFDDGGTVSMVTYSEIQTSSRRIADVLIDLGCKDQCIGVYCEPALMIPAILLGILESSCSFVPLDPHAPAHINTHVISFTQLQVVLVQTSQLMSFLDTLGTAFPIKIASDGDKLQTEGIIMVKIQQEGIKVTSSRNLGLAYVMHSSGTTGQPKVIRVPHRCIVPNIIHLREAFNICATDVIFNAATLTFDTSIVEIFLALSQGASVLMVPAAVKLMPKRLMGILMRNHVTVIQATPTLIQRFDDSLLCSQLFGDDSSLRIMAFGGESCPTPAMIHQWRGNGNKTQFYNIYGITEVSCWASLYRIPDADIHGIVNLSVPIGDPLQDTQLEVRNKDGQPLCGGGHGTLFIGGNHRVCFINNEDASSMAECVMRDTGDLVEFTIRGLVYLGRHDNQVKRHGKRITLSQIQQIVEIVSCVSSCAAVIDGQQLLLFCVPVDKNISPIPQCISPTENFLLELNDILPSHGVPDDVFWVNDLPLTLHGKLDRHGLVQMAREIKNAGDTIVDCIGVSEKLNELWKRLLRQGTTTDQSSNFLELGGDSFKSIQMSTAMETWTRKPLIDFVDILLHKTFQDVVSYVEDVVSRGTEVRTKDVERRPPVASERVLKRSHDQSTWSEYNKELDKEAKCLTSSNTCPKCNLPIAGHTEMCNDHKCLHDMTHNASSSVPIDKIASNCNQTIPSHNAIVTSHHATSYSPCTFWQYSIRRGSQFKFSNRQPGQPSCCCVGIEDDVPKDAARIVGDGKSSINERWKYNTGKCVDASPLIVRWRTGAVVYIGSHSHKFAAIDMETGVALWECSLGDRVESSACLSTCGQFVIVGCYDNCVYFLNSDTGSVFWKFKTDGSVKSSPVADDKTSLVYVGSHDKHLYALNVGAKTCEWRTHCGGGSVFSSPCIYYQTHTVYVGTLAGDLLAICKENGTLRWKYRCPKPIFSSPAVSDTSVIVGCADGILYSFSHCGDKLWTYGTAAPIFSSPCVIASGYPRISSQSAGVCTNYVLFGSHDQDVYCLDKTSGKLLWRTKLPSQVYSTPFIFPCERLDPSRIEASDESLHEPIRKHVRLSDKKDAHPIGDGVGKDDGIVRLRDNAQKSVDVRIVDHNHGEESGTSCDGDGVDRTQDKIIRCKSNLTRSETENDDSLFVAVACTSGVVAILDMATGHLLSSFTLPGEVFSSPVFHEGKIMVGCRDDFVYCLNIN